MHDGVKQRHVLCPFNGQLVERVVFNHGRNADEWLAELAEDERAALVYDLHVHEATCAPETVTTAVTTASTTAVTTAFTTAVTTEVTTTVTTAVTTVVTTEVTTAVTWLKCFRHKAKATLNQF